MKTWLKVLLVLFVVGIATAILVYFFIINKPHKNIEKAKTDYTLTAKDLYDSYKNNKAKSDSLYNDKILIVSGTLNKVETPDSAVVAVFVFDKDEMFGDKGVRCTMLPKYSLTMSRAKTGIEIKIKGQCKGFADDVILEKCSVIK